MDAIQEAVDRYFTNVDLTQRKIKFPPIDEQDTSYRKHG
jgi:hypothetical protein